MRGYILFRNVQQLKALEGGIMKMKRLGVAAKVGVFLLLFAFLLAPASSGIAQQAPASTAGGAGAADAGGTGAGAAGAGAAGAGGTAGISTTAVVGAMLGVAVLAGVLAAAASGDDGAVTTTHHP